VALIMLGLHLNYSWLIASAVLLGLANSVYHPADYAILSAHMDAARMGRAFSIHTFAGYVGGAVARVDRRCHRRLRDSGSPRCCESARSLVRGLNAPTFPATVTRMGFRCVSRCSPPRWVSC